MAAEGRQEKIWKNCWKVWKPHKGGRWQLKFHGNLASIEVILEVLKLKQIILL